MDLAAIERHSPRQADRIREAVARYAIDNRGDVVKMAGGSGIYRLRVGDWRVLFTLDADAGTVDIARVVNRRDAYR